MTFTRRFLALVALATILFAGQAQAAKIKHMVLNGYDTYLINTGMGNGVALTVAVQAGSMHDEPVHHAGRAHLWEHVIHGGSKRFPGQTTLWSMNTELGSEYNAYTADNRIFYHHYIHPSALPQAMELLGAMMSEPEWNSETFKKELETVKNEAFEYQQQDQRALESMAFIHNLAEGHPFRMYRTGTQEQLNAMTVDDLKELYYTNYVPGSMQIIVAGNFETLPSGETPITEEAVIRLIQENFHQPKPDREYKARPLREKHIPGFGGKPKFLEIESKSGSAILDIQLEIKGSPSLEGLEMLGDFLNASEPGSIKKALRDKGWISGASFYPSTVNNLSWFNATLMLTPKGEAERNSIAEFLFSAFGRLLTAGVSPETFEYLRKKNIVSYELLDLHPEQLAETFANQLSTTGLQGKEALARLDFKSRFERVTMLDFKAAAEAVFHTDGMLFTTMINGLQSETVSPIFGRAYRAEEKPELLESLNHHLNMARAQRIAPLSLMLPNFEVAKSDVPMGTGASKARTFHRGNGIQLLLKENHQTTNGALLVSFQSRVMSTQGRLATMFAVNALGKKYAGETGYYQVNGAGIHLAPNKKGGVRIGAEGKSLASAQAVLWIASKIRDFRLSPEELKIEITNYIAGEKRFNDNFTATIANDVSQRAIRRKGKSRADLLEIVKSLTLERVNHELEGLFKAGDLTIAANGDYTEAFLDEFTKSVVKVFPDRLSEKSRTKINKRKVVEIQNSVTLFEKLESQKSPTAYGRSWTFRGPAITPENLAALQLLNEALQERVFAVNRIERELGYVHGFHVDSSDGLTNLVFYGQVEGEDRVPLIEEGWREVLAELRSGKLDAKFDKARRGLLRAHTLIPNTLSGDLDHEVGSFERLGSVEANEQMLHALKTIDAKKVAELGNAYIDADKGKTPRFEVIVGSKLPKSLENCKNVVDSYVAAREKLTKR